MSSTNNSVPGMMYPTQKGMLAGNPRDSAMASMNNKAQLQAHANKTMAGGKKKKYGGAVVVPQMQMLYTPQGGPGSNPNDQITGNAKTSTQGFANAVDDKQATQMGGSRRRKGGNPNWLWGCMSGGKSKRIRKHSKRTRKHRKSRKHKKH
jgi:hypothetical protein